MSRSLLLQSSIIKMSPGGTVLITGGSGYLGQFLVPAFAKGGWKVGYTYNSNPVPTPEGDVTGFKVDLATGEGLQECLDALGELTCVVNTAAHTQPAACEQDVEGARAMNIPIQLLDALERHAQVHGSQPFLVHLSTDHVYDGGSSFYTEEAECRPVNAYGRSKLDGEQLIQQRWPSHAILRSSILYGPPPPAPVQRGLFLQYIDATLAGNKPSTFFHDEYRSPTYVHDMVAACMAACERRDALPAGERVFNVGGPKRLNRVDMARAVAEVRGYDPALVLGGSAWAPSVKRVCATPADISMNCSRARRVLGLRQTPFKEALREVWGP